MSDMYEQLKMDVADPMPEDKFDSSEPYNEQEEDISGLNKMDLSYMAISGTDWTADTIVNQIRKGNILLSPYFQRRDAWSPKMKSRFIESLFLGLPIPQIILAENKEKKGTYIVIDGKQRLLSLQQFVEGDDDGKKLKLIGLEVKENLNKMTYEEIQNSEYADSCKGLFLNTSDCPYLCKITMIDSYGNHINFAKMLSWYEIIAKDKFDFKAFYCADYLLHKEIFLTEKDAQDYVSTNLRSKKNFMQIDKVQRPISSRMVKLFNILSSVDFAALASLH